MHTFNLQSARQLRLESQRTRRQELLRHADQLPTTSRALIIAYLDRGLSVADLATIHNLPPRQMRRRLEQLQKTLADPCFLLAAQYSRKLPPTLEPLARGYWLEGATLRELAARHHQTLHRIRYQILMARSLLLISLAAEHPLTVDQMQSTLAPAFM